MVRGSVCIGKKIIAKGSSSVSLSLTLFISLTFPNPYTRGRAFERRMLPPPPSSVYITGVQKTINDHLQPFFL